MLDTQQDEPLNGCSDYEGALPLPGAWRGGSKSASERAHLSLQSTSSSKSTPTTAGSISPPSILSEDTVERPVASGFRDSRREPFFEDPWEGCRHLIEEDWQAWMDDFHERQRAAQRRRSENRDEIARHGYEGAASDERSSRPPGRGFRPAV
ncbi:unnamed protein product [Effrenium voratum]|uniref:Uncharacterized protein n=1 Tax=Effrenium voratum TaxID=2562239 RepID=A0AA36J555_9DINO|nr:unnamed protein product [Effrenium voratum]CAJ1398671.1 unnamed protein product [Effrenium voratum]